MPQTELAIVIPTLDEARNLPDLLKTLRKLFPEASVVVVDAGSSDGTADLAERSGANVVLRDQPRSRGGQLRAGAAAVDPAWFLFLHADTRLDADAARASADYMRRPDATMAMFQVRFDHASGLLRFSAWCTRFDSVFTRFGDQGILISRPTYDGLGGFKNWPLFEDVDLGRRARRIRPIDILPASVLTSSRRFRRHGVWRQQWRNAVLLIRFLLGADPRKLVRNYPPASDL